MRKVVKKRQGSILNESYEWKWTLSNSYRPDLVWQPLYIHTFDPYKNSQIDSPFYKWGNLSSVQLYNLPKAIYCVYKIIKRPGNWSLGRKGVR